MLIVFLLKSYMDSALWQLQKNVIEDSVEIVIEKLFYVSEDVVPKVKLCMFYHVLDSMSYLFVS